MARVHLSDVDSRITPARITQHVNGGCVITFIGTSNVHSVFLPSRTLSPLRKKSELKQFSVGCTSRCNST